MYVHIHVYIYVPACLYVHCISAGPGEGVDPLEWSHTVVDSLI